MKDFFSIWNYLGIDVISNKVEKDSIIINGNADDIRNSICDYIINIRQLVICYNEDDRRKIINMVRSEWHELDISKKKYKRMWQY